MDRMRKERVRCSCFCLAFVVLSVFWSRPGGHGIQPCLGEDAATGREVDEELGTVHLLHCKWVDELWSFVA